MRRLAREYVAFLREHRRWWAAPILLFLLLLGIPLAGASAYVALRGLVPSKAIRVWAAAAYALLPAMTGAVASGRVGTTILAIFLPLRRASTLNSSTAAANSSR